MFLHYRFLRPVQRRLVLCVRQMLLRPTSQQHLHRLHMPIHGGNVQRSLLEQIKLVYVAVGVHKNPHGISMPVPRSYVRKTLPCLLIHAVDVAAGAQQYLEGISMTVCCSSEHGRPAILIGFVDVGTGIQEDLQCFSFPLLCTREQRGLAINIGFVNVAARLQKNRQCLRVSVVGSSIRGRAAALIGLVHVTAAVHKHHEHSRMPVVCRNVCKSVAILVSDVNVAPRVQQDLQGIRVPVLCSDKRGRLASNVGFVDIAAGVHEDLQGINMPLPCCSVRGSLALLLASPVTSDVFHQLPQFLRIPRSCCSSKLLALPPQSDKAILGLVFYIGHHKRSRPFGVLFPVLLNLLGRSVFIVYQLDCSPFGSNQLIHLECGFTNDIGLRQPVVIAALNPHGRLHAGDRESKHFELGIQCVGDILV
mmetsp:Transcript_57341/g.117371  ORF Transcript_57341/g.117371 Transcript_57341/m.117371 type:complete len:420 (+) Transcript_57341:461-1720(+)